MRRDRGQKDDSPMRAHPPGTLVLSRAHWVISEACEAACTAVLQQDREHSWEREEGQELLRDLFGCPLLLDNFHLSEEGCPHSTMQLNPSTSPQASTTALTCLVPTRERDPQTKICPHPLLVLDEASLEYFVLVLLPFSLAPFPQLKILCRGHAKSLVAVAEPLR